MKSTFTVDADHFQIMKDLIKELSQDNKAPTQQEFFNSMVMYFKTTGIDPRAKNKSTADELSKLRTTVISFIRAQEKNKLDPIILTLNETLEFMRNYFKNEAVSKEDIKMLVAQKTQEPARTIEQPASGLPGSNYIKDNYEEKYKLMIKHVKTLFADFTKNFKSSTFGGYAIEKPIYEKYKTMFDKLQ
jgi:hypothetical protein